MQDSDLKYTMAYRAKLLEALSAVWDEGERLGIIDAQPAPTRQVRYLAGVLGYAVTDKDLETWLQRRFIPRPAKRGRSLIWTREQAVEILMIAERFRAWLPLHPYHFQKCTCWQADEMAMELAEQSEHFGDAPASIGTMDGTELRELVADIAQSPDVYARRWLSAVLASRFAVSSIRELEEIDDALAQNLRLAVQSESEDERDIYAAAALGRLRALGVAESSGASAWADKAEVDITAPTP